MQYTALTCTGGLQGSTHGRLASHLGRGRGRREGNIGSDGDVSTGSTSRSRVLDATGEEAGIVGADVSRAAFLGTRGVGGTAFDGAVAVAGACGEICIFFAVIRDGSIVLGIASVGGVVATVALIAHEVATASDRQGTATAALLRAHTEKRTLQSLTTVGFHVARVGPAASLGRGAATATGLAPLTRIGAGLDLSLFFLHLLLLFDISLSLAPGSAWIAHKAAAALARRAVARATLPAAFVPFCALVVVVLDVVVIIVISALIVVVLIVLVIATDAQGILPPLKAPPKTRRERFSNDS